MASSVKVKPGFKLAELDLERRLADEASYQQKLRKSQLAMLELEEIYRVERRRGIIALEGWDASGKSGAIQRLIAKLDPRWVDVGRLVDRPAQPGRARPSLPVALLAKAAAARPDRDLRPHLVRPGPRRTRRRPGPTQRVAARL